MKMPSSFRFAFRWVACVLGLALGLSVAAPARANYFDGNNLYEGYFAGRMRMDPSGQIDMFWPSPMGPLSSPPSQALSFETVRGPTVGECGELAEWVIQWKLALISPRGGYIIQHVEATFDVRDCAGNPVKHPLDTEKWNYWEAWKVDANSSVTTYAAMGDKNDDKFKMGTAVYGTSGVVIISGSARFYEDLTLPKMFVPMNEKTNAGILPSTKTDPELPTASATFPISHSITLSWNCCGSKDRSTCHNRKK